MKSKAALRLAQVATAGMVVFLVGITNSVWAAGSVLQAVAPDNINVPARADAKSQASRSSIYIVQLKGDPVISYSGELRAYQATKPGKGKRLNSKSAHVKKYAAYLENMQSDVMHSVGARKVYSYRYAVNGFAARMTAADAERLKARADVLNVWKDEIRQLQTNSSPQYIGITAGGQAWSNGYTGEDVVIASIDTGIWPEHPSFADVPTPKKGNKGPLIPYQAPSDFTSSGCDFGNSGANPQDAPFSCNNKLVTARCYNNGFSSAADPTNPCGGDGAFVIPGEFQSTRDNDGHGSHTAATAGGNNDVPAAIGGEFQGNVSGVAPRAHIASYKVCWNGTNPPAPFSGGCASSDSSAAIDQAVADGVDVINFSVGGPSTVFGGPDDVAFLFAADAGVYVATSNGNSGPAAATTGTPAGVPWLTAVGANQDDQVFNLAVVINAPAALAGERIAVEGNSEVSLADTGPITADVAVAQPADACGPIAPVAGIALVIRGACSFSVKYNNAAAAGATAIIVYNDGTDPSRFDPFTMSAPGTTIPGVMIGFADGNELANATGVNATLDPATQVSASNRVAGFSSRGPNAGAPDIIKPDLGAPGVSILAAQTPIPNDGQPAGELFQNLSGTSMSSPHVAGAFALLKQAHPDWSPAIARSALMTTARQGLKKTFGDEAADPFDIGAGEIVPSKAVDPALAYDAGFLDYLAFSCDNNTQLVTDGTCAALAAAGFSTDGSDLNLPSIGIGELAGSQTITRTVTSVANNNGNKRFTVSVDAPPGIDVTVSPTSFKLKRGQTATYQVTFSANGDASLDEWAFGSLTWNGGKHAVRSPIAIFPVAFSAPAERDASGTTGQIDIPVQFSYDGVYTPELAGIEESLGIPATVTQADGLNFNAFVLPALDHLRFATFDAETTVPGADDIDLRLLYTPDLTCAPPYTLLGGSGGATSEEVIDVEDPAQGCYIFVVDYFAAASGTAIDYTAWIQPVLGDLGNASIVATPANATAGSSGTVTVEYGPLTDDTRHLGIVKHLNEIGEMRRTILDISTQ